MLLVRRQQLSLLAAVIACTEAAFLGAVGATVPQAPALSTGATLSGAVVDPMGGYVPNVTLVLTDARKKERISRTSPVGRFEFLRLPPGEYLLNVRAMGFRFGAENVVVSGESVRRDVTLRLAGVTEAVTVTSVLPATSGNTPMQPPRAPVCAEQVVPGRMGGRVDPPQKSLHAVPGYPEHLKARGLGGVVHVAGVISAQGVPTNLLVVDSAHPDFDRVAIEAMSRWRFLPAYLNCVAAPVDYEVTFEFRPHR